MWKPKKKKNTSIEMHHLRVNTRWVSLSRVSEGVDLDGRMGMEDGLDNSEDPMEGQ